MLEIEELLNNLITEKDYDKRLIPYIKEFFRYNAKEFKWTKEEIAEKIRLIAQKVKGVEFVYLDGRKALTDHSFKNMLVNQDIKDRDLTYEEITELTSEIFLNLEVATKEDEEKEEGYEYWKDNSAYPLISLKYSTNKYDKENILQLISNAFNINVRDVFDIEEIFIRELENSNNDNKVRERYLKDSLTTFIPSLKDSISKIIKSNNFNEKSHAYISIYATCLSSIKYRLENSSEHRQLLKTQYETLSSKLSEISEEYVITADKLKQHKIDNTFVINLEEIDNEIREELKDVKITNEKETKKVSDLGKSLSTEFIQEAPYINKDRKLKDTYIQKTISQILPRYEERFRPFIQEYFTRSAKIYNWTKDEFDKKIRNYQVNVKDMSFTSKINSDNSFTVAAWDHGNIRIKKDIVFISNEFVISSIFHEQEHSTDNTVRNNKNLENGMIGTKYYNINEYATEIGAVHLVGNKIYDDELCFTHSMGGYGEFKYAGSMISAALGISEFEFARLRNKGEAEFEQVLKDRYEYLGIQDEMLEFNQILTRIRHAPVLFNMRELSEAYADVYNMADRIIKARLEHERELAPNQEEFEIKSKYELAKIANNMKLARRKLHLRNKYIKPIIEDDTILKNYYKVTPEDRKKYMYLVEELYPEKNMKFDNEELLKHVNRHFRYPVIGKIANALGINKVPMLNAPTSFEEEKEDFNNRIAVSGVKTNAQELGLDNTGIVNSIEKTEKGNEAK